MENYIELEDLCLELSKILDKISERQLQINLQSKSARDNLSEEIALGLKRKFYFSSFSNTFLEK